MPNRERIVNRADGPPADKYHVPQWLGNKATRRFHVMAKPAGSACNRPAAQWHAARRGLGAWCNAFRQNAPISYAGVFLATALIGAAPAGADEISAEQLAKRVQDPAGNVTCTRWDLT
jgi:hypothetical protein